MIQDGLEAILRLAPVIPVVIVESAAEAVPVARALVKGGLKAIEITLRTPAALEAIRAVAQEVEGAVPGVGTVLTPAQYEQAAKAGAKFAVSPGATPKLLDAVAGFHRLTAAAAHILPHRRHHARERATLPEAAKCHLCRRIMDGEAQRH